MGVVKRVLSNAPGGVNPGQLSSSHFQLLCELKERISLWRGGSDSLRLVGKPACLDPAMLRWAWLPHPGSASQRVKTTPYPEGRDARWQR